MISQHSKVYIAGHRGLAGSAIMRKLQSSGYDNLLFRTSSELDLTDQKKVEEFIAKEKPDLIFLCAAKVGGILANSRFPADFIYQNLLIQNNVIDSARKNGVKRLLFLGSSCIYPRNCPQPIKEEYLLTGQLEATNRPYAIAKISGIEMCWAYNKQYQTKFVCAMPTNLFGPNDNYDLETSHVLPALIRKFHEAKTMKKGSVELWGTGNPRREFLYSDDLADAAVFLMNLSDKEFDEAFISSDKPPIINVGTGKDIKISELASMIGKIVGFNGNIDWDSGKPDGTPQKLLDVSKIDALGWRSTIPLEDGIRLAYTDFKSWIATKE